MSGDDLPTLEVSRLQASRRGCALFIDRGTTDLPIADIAAAAGVSQRTFHRYFPIKADSLGPLFDWMIRRSNDVIVDAAPHVPLPDVLLAAFRGSILSEAAPRADELFPLVFQDPEMWSVFIRKLHDGERSVMPILAPRLGLSADSIAARAAAAAVASAMRIALEAMVTSGADPETVYAQTLEEFASGALRRR
jgi:AcrR family transcriptional regulator